jgi:hypothetical protein
MTACRELLPGQQLQPGGEAAGETPSANPADAPIDASTDEGTWEHRCPKCESLLTASLLTRTGRADRPGWRTVMSGLHRPTWYDDG